MDKKTEALKLALEALEKVTTEMLALKDELAERGARPTTNIFHQRLWDSAFKAYTDHALPAAAAIREALAEQPAQQQEHITDGAPCWCNPVMDYKDADTGAEVWIHKEPQ